ncbi:MAG TPA: Crp/Fnr family transcriptional regulator [Chitinispirillaceae bacterium]|nr:Crp/Fnr family transcriptional regulator [Chitinispirillaceae bacterium]
MKPLSKTIKSGMHLFHQNDRSRELYIIQSGEIKIYRISNGKEIELATLGKGSVLGEMALIDGKPRSASARAITDCVVIRIDAEKFHEKIKDVPPWFMSIIKMTSQKIRRANCRLQNISSEHQGVNIIIALYYLFKRFDPSGNGMQIYTLQSRLITLLGVTHQKIVQILDFLYNSGFINIKDDSVFMVDSSRYKEYCEFLRLLLRKGFEKASPFPRQLSELILTLPDKIPDIIQSYCEVTEIEESVFIEYCAKINLSDNFHSVLMQLRDNNLLSFSKKAEDATSAFLIKISNTEWKRCYLYEKYRNLKPVL